MTVKVPVIAWRRGSGAQVSVCAVADCEGVPLRGGSAIYASAILGSSYVNPIDCAVAGHR